MSGPLRAGNEERAVSGHRFHPLVERWFGERFGKPTTPQAAGWRHIAAGTDTLIAAPTGSGKTLAAFLWAIDGLVRAAATGALADRTRVVYVSPLKALGNDIQKNLQEPLAGIRHLAAEEGLELPEIRVMVRSGDTPAYERQQMVRRPPEAGPVLAVFLLAALLAPGLLFAAPVKSPYQMEVVAEELRGPRGLLFLPDGSLLVAEQAGNTLARIAPDGTLTRIASGLSRPHDIARDAAGALYVADTGNGRVARIAPDGAVSTYVAGLTAPVDLDFDPAGRLIICEFTRGPLKVAEGPGSAEPFGPVLEGAHGLLFERGGGILVVENRGERISRLTGDGRLEPVWQDIKGVGLARGPSGDVYVAEPGAGRVWRLKPGGVEVVVAEGLAGPRDPAFDATGHLYVAETGAGRVVRFVGAF